MRKLLLLLSGLVLLSFACLSHAHQLSTSYLSGNFDNTGVFTGEWQVRLYDLEQSIGVDADGDGNLRWQELQNRADVVTNYLQYHLKFSRANQDCTLALESDWKIDTHFNEGYLVLPVRAQCPINGEVAINYSAFFEVDSQHKLLVSLLNEKNSTPHILSDSTRSIVISEQAGSRFATFKEFVKQGAVHIWIGLDHILFLISLLLTCALTRRNQHWVANQKIREIVWRTTWIVTAFTLAHSITLTATALNFIHLPSRWVEVGIAITVALAALNNIFPVVLRLGWLTFSFGLLHGMGFAGALGELGLPADQQALTVLAFNIGVEIGQLAIVAVVLPVLIIVRKYYWYTRYSMTALSAVIVLIALQWIVQRI
ncbi:MAG: HupE/UreJ family protein [Gammaproteobacteria bacterium]|nr:MAG: HupE/UreJ family protein [Gammaproteobacteria bacterium]